MNRYGDIIDFIIELEGGYVNHPNDPGGETKFGISKRSYPNLDIKNLTRQHAETIYRQDFWEKFNLDKLPPKLGAAVMCAAINHGAGRPIRWLQMLLGVNPDGKIGQQTLRAATACDINEVLIDFHIMREDFFMRNPNFDVFGKGWRRRVFKIFSFIERAL